MGQGAQEEGWALGTMNALSLLFPPDGLHLLPWLHGTRTHPSPFSPVPASPSHFELPTGHLHLHKSLTCTLSRCSPGGDGRGAPRQDTTLKGKQQGWPRLSKDDSSPDPWTVVSSPPRAGRGKCWEVPRWGSGRRDEKEG